MHETDNTKLALRDPIPSVLVRETGVEAYTRVSPALADAGRKYWERSRDFWAQVRSVWDGILVPGAIVTLQRTIDGKTRFERVTALPEAPRESAQATNGRIRAVLDEYMVAPIKQASVAAIPTP